MKALFVLAITAAVTLGLGASLSASGLSLTIEASAKGKKKGPGSCGTYMYWKAGKCVDARITPAKKK